MSENWLRVRKDTNGVVTVTGEKFKSKVDIRGKTPEEALEAVRWAILLAGYVYSEKAEKIARRELGM